MTITEISTVTTGDQRAEDAAMSDFMRGGTERNGVKVTATEARVYDALTNEPDWPGVIANRAGLKNMHRSEAGAKYCILLVGKGLAIKHGTRSFPKWSRAPASAV